MPPVTRKRTRSSIEQLQHTMHSTEAHIVLDASRVAFELEKASANYFDPIRIDPDLCEKPMPPDRPWVPPQSRPPPNMNEIALMGWWALQREREALYENPPPSLSDCEEEIDASLPARVSNYVQRRGRHRDMRVNVRYYSRCLAYWAQGLAKMEGLIAHESS